MFTSAPSSLCILRLSAIGDVCNTIATVQAIQKQWPTTQITWITGKLEAQLLAAIEGVEVIVFDKKAGLDGYKALWKQLKGREFDALLHMQYAIRASVATLGIKAKYKLGFSSDRSQDFQTLFTNVKVPSPQSLHVADGLMAFAHQIGIPNTELDWALSYSAQDQEWAENHVSYDKPNLLIVPGASKAYKNWNAEGYIDVIHHARAQGWNVILAGSPAQVELDLADAIQSRLEEPCLNLVGQSSILQMLALIDKVDMVIAPDTGPAHMASAMNTPIIGLYAHHNPVRVGPYRYLQYAVSVYEEVILAETGKTSQQLSWRTRAKDEKAMNRITSKQVITMFNQVVEDLYPQYQ
ncbi:glycosyltransferase family 9 protein [Vibrio parahaemolyticus]|uniref:glycosyltransferase family 9 protein n=1 Tax=Vibrio parahaemolyticus TaxID=670 RepID=UPI0007DC3B1E|nr:glycosyltransferase family 9 protein [Vibrio parahaemolyticus]AVW93907.1 lipopolysaccharide heptosyltransferase family protein [Vibrio parahaemolyticus]EGQ8736083.1 ADP-heptose--LPS heptosyltransferase I [Vibrio parahaemolyticus]EGQ8905271.1 ADP-heptose--LPS heptosyltransferase I [Vibrio parahaemolyticus]EGR1172445.1 lipopolysaccharide heptosyltransferase family protein [Vibrio parahaemolyticus]EGR3098333.1 lipopolysaccharide heptosyltransferase family protein [Vibrio parahaemolyticus]